MFFLIYFYDDFFTAFVPEKGNRLYNYLRLENQAIYCLDKTTNFWPIKENKTKFSETKRPLFNRRKSPGEFS